MEKSEAKALCKKHINRYVLIQMNDGQVFDGIIESVDEDNIYLAVPIGDGQMMGHAGPAPHGHHCGCGQHGYPYHHGPFDGHQTRQPIAPYGGFYGPGFYGPGFGFAPGFYGPRRRFNRLILPLAAFTALSLLPYF